MKGITRVCRVAVALLACVFAFAALAVPVSQETSARVARAWASRGYVFNTKIGTSVAKAASHVTSKGVTFHSFKMSGGGTVFTSADTEIDPILAFTSDPSDFSELDPESPLAALLSRTLDTRVAVRNFKGAVAPGAAEAPRATKAWTELLELADALPPENMKFAASGIASIGDVRVAPLVQSKWNQGEAGIHPCYNACTPKNYVCGCVATAMCQIMRRWCYPTAVVEPRTETCTVDGVEVSLTMQGGVYDWANMPLEPNANTSEVERRAIGTLTSDAGISVRMKYSGSGSGSFTSDAGDALRDVFGYASAEYYTPPPSQTDSDGFRDLNIGTNLYSGILYANLDAGCPVLMGIGIKVTTEEGDSFVGEGHAIVADGYGFDGEAAYTHLNMGWSGQDDFWYLLPDMQTTGYAFDTFDEAVYNIFPTMTGRILSGRVFNPDGVGVEGVTVEVRSGGGLVTQVVSKAYGVYGAILPAGTYQVRAVDPIADTASTDTVVTLGADEIGNSWGNDLRMKYPVSATVEGREFRILEEALDYADEFAVEGIPVVVELARDIPFRNHEKVWEFNFDCTISGGCHMVECSAPLVVCDNTVLTLADLALTGPGAFVHVAGGGTLILAGTVAIDGISLEDGARLILADDFAFAENAFTVIDAPTASGPGGQFAMSKLSDRAAVNSLAGRFVNAASDDLYGVAGTSDAGTPLVWDFVPVPVEAAVARLDQDGSHACFRSLDQALFYVTNNAAITVLRDCAMTGAARVAAGTTLVVSSLSGACVTPSAGFTVEVGATLVISNLTFADYTLGAVPLFAVDGGSLTLARGAALSRIEYRRKDVTGAPVFVKNGGILTIEDGVTISDCSNTKSYGGAIQLGNNCQLNLFGGIITGCAVSGEGMGGGIYAPSSAVVCRGAPIVRGNANARGADDLYRKSGSRIQVLDELSGAEIGLRLGRASGLPDASSTNGVFAVAADGFTGDPAIAASAFRNDVDLDLVADYNPATGEYFWTTDHGFMPHQVVEGDPSAVARVNVGSETTWWDDLGAAFASVGGRVAAIGLEKSVSLESLIDVSGEVVFTGMTEGLVVNRIIDPRKGVDSGFRVPAGSSLSIGNLVLDGETASPSRIPFVHAVGGAITLDEGCVIRGVRGTGSRAAVAVAVESFGMFTMRGATIMDCRNDFVNVSEGTGVGAGVLVDSGEAFLQGGVVKNCVAYRAAGVFIGNTAVVRISGDWTISGNATLDGSAANLCVADLSRLFLVAPLSGTIGYTAGFGGDTNVFGVVDENFVGSEAERDASAACFTNDVTGAPGLVAVGETHTLLTWVPDFDANGFVLAFPGADAISFLTNYPTVVAIGEVIRDSATGLWRLTVDRGVAYCIYTLYRASGLERRFVAVEGTRRQVRDDGPVVFDGIDIGTDAQQFWRVIAEPGEIPLDWRSLNRKRGK